MAKIQQCKCGARYNVEKFQPGSRFKCKKCGNVLQVDSVETPQAIAPEMPVPIAETPKRPERRPSRPTPAAEVPAPIADDPPRRPSRPRSRRPERPADTREERPTRGKRPPSGRRPRVSRDEPRTDPVKETKPRRRPPSGRRKAISDETRPVAPVELPPEPEIKVETIPEGAFVGKEDFAEKRAEVLKTSPGFLVPFIINLVIFLACIGGGIYAINNFAKAPDASDADNMIKAYDKTSSDITKRFDELTAQAESLGTVSASSVIKSVRMRYSNASKIATRATVTVISDIDIFQRGRSQRIEYYGSGFIFKPETDKKVTGYVLTCYENIAGARSIKIMLSDHTIYSARIIGKDVPANLAVLQLNKDEVRKRKPKLYALKWADSDKIKKNVAQYVISVGTPLGRTNSVALGVISCPDRYTLYKIRTGEVSGFYNQFFQTDAQINWGSSGGPLVDLDGNVAAVCVTTTGIYTAFHLSNYNGLFFAIQSNFAKKIANLLKKDGKIKRSYTGILVDSLQSLDLDRNFRGTAVVGIEAGSPAEATELAPGDIITKVTYTDNSGQKVSIPLHARYQPDLAIIYDKLASLPIGTEVTFEVRDIDKTKKASVKFKTAPLPTTATQVINAPKWGMVVAPLSPQDIIAFGLPDSKGVKILAVMGGSPAARAGIQAGNVILQIGGKLIEDVKSFESRYENLNSARTKEVLIEIRRHSRGRGRLASEILRMMVHY